MCDHNIHLMCTKTTIYIKKIFKKKKYLIFFFFNFFFFFSFLHKKYQGRPHFARVGGIPETRVLFCLALVFASVSHWAISVPASLGKDALSSLPSHSVSLLSHSVGLPSHCVGLPSHSVGLPSHSAPCRPIASLIAGLPSHSVGLSFYSVGLPSLSIGLPSHRAVMPPWCRLFRVPRHTTQQGGNNTLEGGGPSHDNGRPSLDGGQTCVNRR